MLKTVTELPGLGRLFEPMVKELAEGRAS